MASPSRARLEGNEFRGAEVIWRQEPKTIGRGHFSARLAFAADGTLYTRLGSCMNGPMAASPPSEW